MAGRFARSAGPVGCVSATTPVVVALAGPPPFKRWTVDRVDISHQPASPILPATIYLNTIGPSGLVARASQGAVNRAQLGTLDLLPGDIVYVVWTPSGSTAVGTQCRATMEGAEQ